MPLRLGGFRRAAHQLGVQGRQPRLARRRTGSRPRHLHPGGRQSQGSDRRRRPARPRRWPWRCPRDPARFPISCATCGPSTARASPRKIAAVPNCTRSAPSACARSAVRASLEEFLASLQLEVAIAPMEAAQVDRVAQLTQRTNQMNATCIRRTAAEIQRLRRGVPHRPRDRPLRQLRPDRRHDLPRGRPRALVVDTFLLSCRALGRGVEHRMVARLGEIALERGLERVEIPFVAGQRNRPALLFLESLGRADADGVFRFCAAQAGRECSTSPATGAACRACRAAEGRPAPRRRQRASRTPASPPNCATPEQILARIRAASRRAVPVARSRAAAHRARARPGRRSGPSCSTSTPSAFTTTSSSSAATRCSPCNCSRACARSTAWSCRSKWCTAANSPWPNWPRRSS